MGFAETSHKKTNSGDNWGRYSFKISQYQNAAAIFLIDFSRLTKL